MSDLSKQICDTLEIGGKEEVNLIKDHIQLYFTFLIKYDKFKPRAFHIANAFQNNNEEEKFSCIYFGGHVQDLPSWRTLQMRPRDIVIYDC